MRASRLAIAACVILLAACGGGGGSAPTLPAAGHSGGATDGTVRFTLLIPAASPASARHRAFVSPSTNGVLVTTFAHSDTTHADPLATAVTNVSSGSNACTTSATGRSCTVSVVAPAGVDDFVFALYDTAPVNGAIPSGAHELGIADVADQTIDAGQNNTVTAPVSAIVAAFGSSPMRLGYGDDGYAHTVALSIAPQDFGDNLISAGATNAPFANPITVSVSESNGSGHTTLALDGGAPASTVTVSKATDTVSVLYDGAASLGYQATVTLAASPVGGQGGATQQTLVLSRSALSVANPTVFYSPSPATLTTYPAGQHLLKISNPGAAAGTTYTIAANGCSGIAAATPVIGSGSSASALVVGGPTTSTSGCSLTVQTGNPTGTGSASFLIAVPNVLRSPPPAPGSATIDYYPIASAVSIVDIATGADGNLWFSDQDADSISSASSAGSLTEAYPLAADAFVSPQGIALGPDGKIWFGDCASTQVGSITTTGTISPYTVSQPGTLFATPDLQGNMWFDEAFDSSSDVISVATATGALAQSPAPIDNINGMTLGSDGNVWFGSAQGLVGNLAIDGTYPISISGPFVLTGGADGNIWMSTSAGMGRMLIDGSAYTDFPVSGSYTIFVTAGPDGAVWFADNGNSAIGRITMNGTVTEYPVSSSPTGIAVGPDGNIWFTEDTAIGKIVL